MQRDSTRAERQASRDTSSLHWIFSMPSIASPIAGKKSACPTRLGAMACGMYLVAEVRARRLQAADRPSARPKSIAALAAKPARFTKAMLRHGLDYVQQRYGQPPRRR